MDTLSPADGKLFHKLMDRLLFYANKKTGVIENCSSLDEFHHNDIEKTILIREKIFSDNKLIDEYIAENPDSLSDEELQIVASWKKHLKSDFYLVKYAKEYALFLHSKEQKVYGVKGIMDSFNEKFNGYSPVIIKVRLLPFRDHVIYDGIFFPFHVMFGRRMRSTIKVETDAAIQKYGVLTSLEPVSEKKTSDEELLRFYLKSSDTRERYYDEIEKLRSTSPELEAVYEQEDARIIGRDIKKSLKLRGVKGHFAVLVNTVVASGATERELNENITKMVPEEKRSWLYRFKI